MKGPGQPPCWAGNRGGEGARPHWPSPSRVASPCSGRQVASGLATSPRGRGKAQVTEPVARCLRREVTPFPPARRAHPRPPAPLPGLLPDAHGYGAHGNLLHGPRLATEPRRRPARGWALPGSCKRPLGPWTLRPVPPDSRLHAGRCPPTHRPLCHLRLVGRLRPPWPALCFQCDSESPRERAPAIAPSLPSESGGFSVWGPLAWTQPPSSLRRSAS